MCKFELSLDREYLAEQLVEEVIEQWIGSVERACLALEYLPCSMERRALTSSKLSKVAGKRTKSSIAATAKVSLLWFLTPSFNSLSP